MIRSPYQSYLWEKKSVDRSSRRTRSEGSGGCSVFDRLHDHSKVRQRRLDNLRNDVLELRDRQIKDSSFIQSPVGQSLSRAHETTYSVYSDQDRLYWIGKDWMIRRDKKHAELREAQEKMREEEEMSEVTLQPKFSTPKSSRPQRFDYSETFDQMYEAASVYDRQREQLVERMEYQRREEAHFFPQIDPHSKRLANRRIRRNKESQEMREDDCLSSCRSVETLDQAESSHQWGTSGNNSLDDCGLGRSVRTVETATTVVNAFHDTQHCHQQQHQSQQCEQYHLDSFHCPVSPTSKRADKSITTDQNNAQPDEARATSNGGGERYASNDRDDQGDYNGDVSKGRIRGHTRQDSHATTATMSTLSTMQSMRTADILWDELGEYGNCNDDGNFNNDNDGNDTKNYNDIGNRRSYSNDNSHFLYPDLARSDIQASPITTLCESYTEKRRMEYHETADTRHHERLLSKEGAHIDNPFEDQELLAECASECRSGWSASKTPHSATSSSSSSGRPSFSSSAHRRTHHSSQSTTVFDRLHGAYWEQEDQKRRVALAHAYSHQPDTSLTRSHRPDDDTNRGAFFDRLHSHSNPRPAPICNGEPTVETELSSPTQEPRNILSEQQLNAYRQVEWKQESEKRLKVRREQIIQTKRSPSPRNDISVRIARDRRKQTIEDIFDVLCITTKPLLKDSYIPVSDLEGLITNDLLRAHVLLSDSDAHHRMATAGADPGSPVRLRSLLPPATNEPRPTLHLHFPSKTVVEALSGGTAADRNPVSKGRQLLHPDTMSSIGGNANSIECISTTAETLDASLVNPSQLVNPALAAAMDLVMEIICGTYNSIGGCKDSCRNDGCDDSNSSGHLISKEDFVGLVTHLIESADDPRHSYCHPFATLGQTLSDIDRAHRPVYQQRRKGLLSSEQAELLHCTARPLVPPSPSSLTKTGKVSHRPPDVPLEDFLMGYKHTQEERLTVKREEQEEKESIQRQCLFIAQSFANSPVPRSPDREVSPSRSGRFPDGSRLADQSVEDYLMEYKHVREERLSVKRGQKEEEREEEMRTACPFVPCIDRSFAKTPDPSPAKATYAPAQRYSSQAAEVPVV